MKLLVNYVIVILFVIILAFITGSKLEKSWHVVHRSNKNDWNDEVSGLNISLLTEKRFAHRDVSVDIKKVLFTLIFYGKYYILAIQVSLAVPMIYIISKYQYLNSKASSLDLVWVETTIFLIFSS
jgi:hypothetical protein